MITDVPSSIDFQNAGSNLLNLAWDSTISLLIDRRDLYEIGKTSQVTELYWRAAQPILSSSLSLVQQGVEFFLKGKIAKVSPYLLIIGSLSNFPKNSHKQSTSFSDFRTIDAQDLIRVHDTVSETRVSDSFCQWYDELRRLRNKLMHTVDKTTVINDKDVLIHIMEACDYCIESRSWIDVRSQYLMKSPDEYLFQDIPISDDERIAYHLEQLQSEIMTVIEYLEPQHAKRFFGFQKKEQRYLCLHCLSVRQGEFDFEFSDSQKTLLHTAQIVDSGLSPLDIVYCIFCEGYYRIKKEKCKNCGHEIVDAHNGLCLSCTEFIPKNIELQSSNNL
jgi:hypothetical protein